MTDNPFLLRAQPQASAAGETGGSATELYLGTVTSVDASGVKIRFDGDTEATDKQYKQIVTGVTLSAGDRIVAAKISGSYVVLGRISADQTSGSTSYYGLSSDSVSVPSDEWTQVQSVTLAPGLYIAYACLMWVKNTDAYTGEYGLMFSTTTAPAGPGRGTGSWIRATGESATNANYRFIHNITVPLRVQTETVYRVYAYQNSGAARAASAQIRYLKLAQ